MHDVVPAGAPVRVPVRGSGTFPVHRVYCVGRNFAEHAREMGADAPASQAERGTPVFFLKPADAVVVDGTVPYPRGTQDLQHEVELVVALGRDANGIIDTAAAASFVFGYAVGLDLTRRDLQTAAKAKGLPWDTGKAFDACAPVGEIVPVAAAGDIGAAELVLHINGDERQRGRLSDLIWSMPDILHALSTLYALRAGDLVFMGTPAGVGPLQPGDRWDARLGDIATCRGRITAPAFAV